MVGEAGEGGGGKLPEGEDGAFDAGGVFSGWGCLEGDAEGSEGCGE